MKPRRPVNLTSPGNPGAFLSPNASLCNRPAQAPAFAFKAALPAAPSLSLPGPVPPRLAEARPVSRPVSAAVKFGANNRGSVLPLSRPRACLCRRRAALPLPRRPSAVLIGKKHPLPPACCRPRAAPEGWEPPSPPIPCRRPAVRRRKKGGL